MLVRGTICTKQWHIQLYKTNTTGHKRPDKVRHNYNERLQYVTNIKLTRKKNQQKIRIEQILQRNEFYIYFSTQQQNTHSFQQYMQLSPKLTIY